MVDPMVRMAKTQAWGVLETTCVFDVWARMAFTGHFAVTQAMLGFPAV